MRKVTRGSCEGGPPFWMQSNSRRTADQTPSPSPALGACSSTISLLATSRSCALRSKVRRHKAKSRSPKVGLARTWPAVVQGAPHSGHATKLCRAPCRSPTGKKGPSIGVSFHVDQLFLQLISSGRLAVKVTRGNDGATRVTNHSFFLV